MNDNYIKYTTTVTLNKVLMITSLDFTVRFDFTV